MEQFLKQLDELLAEYSQLKEEDRKNSAGDYYAFLTRSRAAISNMTRKDSSYMIHFEAVFEEHKKWQIDLTAELIVGVLEALRKDIASGYMQSHAELIHGELFSDFLEMSQHLLDEGYKDAAAVIAGSSLEAHLRQLCVKNGIDTENKNDKGIKPKKADQLNSELAKAKVYYKPDQKNVTAWLGTRNDAAHGKYDQYEKMQVSLLIASIRDFITRNPA